MAGKNVILVIIDSLRQDHVGAYGNQWIRTPNLDAFFSESVRFTRAFPESLPTLPFRRSLMTGKRTFPFHGWKPFKAFYPLSNFGSPHFPQGWTPIPDEDITLADHLNDRGYSTSLVTDVFHQHYPGMNYHRGFQTWDFIRGQEYDMWKSDTRRGRSEPEREFITDRMDVNSRKPWELRRHLINNRHREYEEQYFPAQVFRSAANWMETNYSNDGFFMTVDCFDPHEPWDPPQHYRDLYNPDYRGTEVMVPLYHDNYKDYLSDAELKHMRALYAAECTMVDTWFGFFMNKIKLLGLDKKSMIVVISDHGHQLGENGFTGKVPWGLIPCLVDLVLGIRYPDGTGAGEICDEFVLNHDLFPTILNFLGEDIPRQNQGHDLSDLILKEKKQIRDNITCCCKDYFLVRNHDYSLIAKSDKSETELYDLKKDPDHTTDIAEKEPGKVEEMWQTLLKEAGGDIPVYGGFRETLLERTRRAGDKKL